MPVAAHPRRAFTLIELLVSMALIAVVTLGSAIVSALALGLLAYTLDQRASTNEPTEEAILTVEAVVGQEAYADGSTMFILQMRDSTGTTSSMMSPIEAATGDRIKWRYRRTRWLRLPILPADLVKCGADTPC